MSGAKPENQIDSIELPMRDPERTKSFYTSVFGWKFEDYGPNYTSFRDGRFSGGFAKERPGEPPAPAQRILLVIYASDLPATEANIKASGGTIVKPIFPFPGGQRFHFADPNGNELAVWSELS